jgi:hypothetical protein
VTIKTYPLFRKTGFTVKKNWGIDHYGGDGKHNRMTPKSDGHGVAYNLQRQRIGDTIGLGYALEHGVGLVEAVAELTEG